jgi:hypothetical protein
VTITPIIGKSYYYFQAFTTKSEFDAVLHALAYGQKDSTA